MGERKRYPTAKQFFQMEVPTVAFKEYSVSRQ